VPYDLRMSIEPGLVDRRGASLRRRDRDAILTSTEPKQGAASVAANR
jgi:hypothetical protein